MFKKIVFVLIISFLTIVVKSQSLMTIGEIYDYDIGDIFHRSTGFPGPPTLTKTTITNKYFSAALDTVFYEYGLYIFTSPACPPPCTWSSGATSGNVMFYTNLNDTVGNDLGTELTYFPSGCIDTTGYTGTWLDSIYYDSSFCNRLTTYIQIMDNGPMYNPTDSCFSFFEGHWGYYIFGKGLGMRANYYNSCAEGFPNCETGSSLFYYQKGTESCGTPSPILVNPIFVSVHENNFSEKQIQISPNPANDKITISEWCFKLQILDARGKVIKEIYETNSSDISDLTSGVYIVKEYNKKNNLLGVQKFVKLSN